MPKTAETPVYLNEVTQQAQAIEAYRFALLEAARTLAAVVNDRQHAVWCAHRVERRVACDCSLRLARQELRGLYQLVGIGGTPADVHGAVRGNGVGFDRGRAFCPCCLCGEEEMASECPGQIDDLDRFLLADRGFDFVAGQWRVPGGRSREQHRA